MNNSEILELMEETSLMLDLALRYKAVDTFFANSAYAFIYSEDDDEYNSMVDNVVELGTWVGVLHRDFMDGIAEDKEYGIIDSNLKVIEDYINSLEKDDY